MSSPEERAADKDSEVDDRAKAPADDEDGEGPVDNDGSEEDDDGENDDEEDDDEEDEDEEEADRGHQHKRRKRNKRSRRNQFLDVEAEVDEDEEEEEEEDDEGKEGFVADTHPDDEGLDAGDMDDRRHRQLDLRRQREDENDYHAMAERLDQRFASYGKKSANIAQSSVTPRNYLFPSTEDPRIWAVTCKQGAEREIVFAINKRVIKSFKSKDPIRICSVFERHETTMHSYVYVEAYNSREVVKACENINFCYVHSRMQLLGTEEMPDLFRIKKQKPLEPGMFVRLKRAAKYTGDLAQVDSVESSGLNATVHIVPRLDYGAFDEVKTPQDSTKRKRPGAFARNTKRNRPPARLFNENEAKKRHAHHLSVGQLSGRVQYFNELYVNGLLEKDFKLSFLTTEDVHPTPEEVAVFARARSGDDTVDAQTVATTIKAAGASAKFNQSDKVQIFEGEQKGIQGRIQNTKDEIVSILVEGGPMSGRVVDAPTGSVRKMFKIGDHIKVTAGGRFSGETGSVITIKDDRVTFVRDRDGEAVTLFSRDLTEAEAAGTLSASHGGYAYLDVVKLDSANVAMVISVTATTLEIMTQTGAVRRVPNTPDAFPKITRGDPPPKDANGDLISIGETVTETYGARKESKVRAFHNGVLFLQNPLAAQSTNSGVTVLKPNQVVSKVSNANRTLDKRNAANPRNLPPPDNRPSRGPRDPFSGKTVQVKKGVDKGLRGLVRSTHSVNGVWHLRVEIAMRKKLPTYSEDEVRLIDPETLQPLDMGSSGRGFSGSTFGGSRPSNGGATPRPGWDASGRTPAMGYGGQPYRQPPPAWAAGGNNTAYGGGRTPGWKTAAAASRTAYGGGGATAYGGGGGATAYGGATSYGGGTSYGGATSYGGGGGGWDGSRTPAAAAPTPGGYAAETPAANAYTPAAAAATPGGYAQTPGAQGQGDEGYED